jgi:hypothetical protein
MWLELPRANGLDENQSKDPSTGAQIDVEEQLNASV